MTAVMYYLLIINVFVFFLCAAYLLYVAMVVTPRVNKLNGYNFGASYLVNLQQSGVYLSAFFPPAFLKKTKYYSECLSMYKAEPRDLMLFRLSIYCMVLVTLASISLYLITESFS
jgi:hypothetical protein